MQLKQVSCEFYLSQTINICRENVWEQALTSGVHLLKFSEKLKRKFQSLPKTFKSTYMNETN